MGLSASCNEFWSVRRHGRAAVHDLLKLEGVKHCYDERIGGISREAPLVSAPDSDAALEARAPRHLADAGARRVAPRGRGWRACRGVNETYRHLGAGLF